MKVHILEALGGGVKPSQIGDILIFVKRKMKVTEIQNINPETNRLTLED